MVTEPTTMSVRSKREYLSRIYGRYARAGREHKSRILDEFCAVCGYHRKVAVRLLNRVSKPRRRPGPKPKYDFEQLRPSLTKLWLEMGQPCSKVLKVSLRLWLPFAPEVPEKIQRDLLA